MVVDVDLWVVVESGGHRRRCNGWVLLSCLRFSEAYGMIMRTWACLAGSCCIRKGVEDF